ncbi:glycosyltransferase family 2 protein [Candidatus Saccharibacteria bacterium]|nr:glycosyltransferase family 2 protein [Candidatus Saccharibacteria bacterium]MCB9821512.1 glycosyltransferase family 2 protein [Candidatus Nomurabacteria bacterium]
MLILNILLGCIVLEILAVWQVKNNISRRVIGSFALVMNLALLYFCFKVFGDRFIATDTRAIYMIVIALITLYSIVNLIKLIYGRVVYRRLFRSTLRTVSILSILMAIIGVMDMLDIQINLEVFLVFILGINLSLAYFSLRSWKTFRAPKAKHSLVDAQLPSVSVLVPARDETEELLECLDSLVASNYPKLEIIVLDDCSGNKRTADIIKQFANKGVRFIAGKQPDDEWLGKNFAYESLRQQADGEYLVFLGADIRVGQHTIKNVIEHMSGTNIKMVSVLPMRAEGTRQSLTAPLRYFWEFSLPRRLTKKPPVLSSFWVVSADALNKFGGFKGVSRSIIPERHIARASGTGYRFWLANKLNIQVYSAKSYQAQRETAIVQRYPQCKRRLERVAVFSIMLAVIGLGPLSLLFYSPILSGASILLLSLSVYISEQTVTGTQFIRACMSLPLLINEIVLINISMIKYEFGKVFWKGRNVCLPVMRVYKALPKI